MNHDAAEFPYEHWKQSGTVTPADTSSFPVLLARSVLEYLPGVLLQRIAITLLERGYDCPELHELAWDPVITTREAIPLLNEAVTALELRLPSQTEAVAILVHHYISEIASGRCSPEEGLNRIMRNSWRPEPLWSTASDPAGDCYDTQEFINAYYRYDNLTFDPDSFHYQNNYGDAAFLALDKHVKELAAAWLLRHPSPPAIDF